MKSGSDMCSFLLRGRIAWFPPWQIESFLPLFLLWSFSFWEPAVLESQCYSLNLPCLQFCDDAARGGGFARNGHVPRIQACDPAWHAAQGAQGFLEWSTVFEKNANAHSDWSPVICYTVGGTLQFAHVLQYSTIMCDCEWPLHYFHNVIFFPNDSKMIGACLPHRLFLFQYSLHVYGIIKSQNFEIKNSNHYFSSNFCDTVDWPHKF